jgi:hypothetical protein
MACLTQETLRQDEAAHRSRYQRKTLEYLSRIYNADGRTASQPVLAIRPRRPLTEMNRAFLAQTDDTTCPSLRVDNYSFFRYCNELRDEISKKEEKAISDSTQSNELLLMPNCSNRRRSGGH